MGKGHARVSLLIRVVLNRDTIKILMIKKNLNYVRTAERIGISHQFFYELMINRKHPSSETRKKIQEAFKGHSWESLFTIEQMTTTSGTFDVQ